MLLTLCGCACRPTVSNQDPLLASLRVLLHATPRRQAALMHSPSTGRLFLESPFLGTSPYSGLLESGISLNQENCCIYGQAIVAGGVGTCSFCSCMA